MCVFAQSSSPSDGDVGNEARSKSPQPTISEKQVMQVDHEHVKVNIVADKVFLIEQENRERLCEES